MHAQRVDLITRHAAYGISRRGSVLALGGASLAALANGPNATARNRNKNRKRKKRNGRKCRKKARRRADDACQREAAVCEATFLALDQPESVPCCASLATCDYATFFDCATATD